jgi:hypothetical protein
LQYRKYPNIKRPIFRFREEWNGNITTTLFSYFSFSEMVKLSGVCRMFFEITGSKAVLSQFKKGNSTNETIDRVFPEHERHHYHYVLVDRRERSTSNRRAHPRIRVNSISPVSINSSVIEGNDYDIIRDEVGYSKLIGRYFNSIRSNSSKYVSEASKFKNPSDVNSSKDLYS